LHLICGFYNVAEAPLIPSGKCRNLPRCGEGPGAFLTNLQRGLLDELEIKGDTYAIHQDLTLVDQFLVGDLAI
jgi:hypothetical protein